jgi:hypothetical protein
MLVIAADLTWELGPVRLPTWRAAHRICGRARYRFFLFFLERVDFAFSEGDACPGVIIYIFSFVFLGRTVQGVRLNARPRQARVGRVLHPLIFFIT